VFGHGSMDTEFAFNELWAAIKHLEDFIDRKGSRVDLNVSQLTPWKPQKGWRSHNRDFLEHRSVFEHIYVWSVVYVMTETFLERLELLEAKFERRQAFEFLLGINEHHMLITRLKRLDNLNHSSDNWLVKMLITRYSGRAPALTSHSSTCSMCDEEPLLILICNLDHSSGVESAIDLQERHTLGRTKGARSSCGCKPGIECGTVRQLTNISEVISGGMD
jgi:hypothetical protein